MIKQAAVENNKLTGIAVSSGIVIGKARLVDRSKQKIIYQYLINENEINREVERLKNALEVTKEQILSLKNRIPESIKEHSFILDTHLMIVEDNMVSGATINTILEERINAEWALKKSVQKIRQLFNQVDFEYIRDRINDVENVVERILRNLAGKKQESLSNINEKVIIVAHDLTPADTSEINTSMVMGFITDVGGKTSHTAIMAQALKIPAVLGLEKATGSIEDGNLLIVDGYKGEIIINPDDDLIIMYQEKALYYKNYISSILQLSHLPSETTDGYRMAVKANVEFLEELETAKDNGAEGIGLYRTEFLYIRNKGVPSEAELFQNYREIAEKVTPFPVTIRTLDIGGDKIFPNKKPLTEANPALGLRAIRFCLKEQEIFRSQLRAILRASVYGNIRIMFPMISGVQEFIDAKGIMSQVMAELEKENISFDKNIKVGAMIEIPSAVMVADILAENADFFSIGTNDLIQYTLAIDRSNENVAYMYEPYHPAVIRMIMQIVRAAHNAGIEVSLCGEMAGDPFCIPILLGMGINELSLTATGIPQLKKLIRSLSKAQAEKDLENILKLKTSEEVRKYIHTITKDYLPDINGNGYKLTH
jgi:phosphoenolpyruvate-protein phosphotransferase (PTS system enzyme I)